MKKSKRLLLLLLIALATLWAAMAQDQTTVTVCDGSSTNNAIPIYGDNVIYEDYLNSEFIIPSTTLGMDDLEGGVISKLTFYISNYPNDWGSPTFRVYMGEVEGTTIDCLQQGQDQENFTTVYTGTLSNSNSNRKMEITLDQPYTYQGGNLLIGTYMLTRGDASYSQSHATNFYGVGASGNASKYNLGSGCGITQWFLPKTTFTYTSAFSMPKPTDFAASTCSLTKPR